MAKKKTSPDIFTSRQMRGAEWDEPKQKELAKLERLGAIPEITADDPLIKGWSVCQTDWAGRTKRKDDASELSKNTRCILRGDLIKKSYLVDANQCFAPVGRHTSFCALEAVGCLREQHYTSGDVPGAYLQGVQKASEQMVTRPPPLRQAPTA